MTESRFGVIDSNLLIYAVDRSEGHKHEQALEFVMNRLRTGDACLSIQNLVEFHHVVTRKIRKPLDKDKSKSFILRLSDALAVIGYSHKTILRAISYQQLYSLPFWDSLLTATMEDNAIEVIYTENEKDFKKIPWLKVINPLKDS